LKIFNTTKYRVDDLRAFLYWVAKEEGHSSSYTKSLVAEIVPSRRWHTGCAPLNGRHITIRIPKPDILDKPKMASLIAHEMLHNHQTHESFKRYSTERSMRGRSRYGHIDCEKFWSGADKLEMRLAEPKAQKLKGPHDKALEGQSKAAKKVADYEKKIKRQENLLKKWKKKLKYYDKRVDVTKDMPAPEPRQATTPKVQKKVRPVHMTEDGKVAVLLSELIYGELTCVEVDTFDYSSPEEYGDRNRFNERKAFCDAMEKAKVVGKKMGSRKYWVTFDLDGAEYFAHAADAFALEEDHPTAARSLADRQYHAGALIAQKAASEGREYKPVRGRI